MFTMNRHLARLATLLSLGLAALQAAGPSPLLTQSEDKLIAVLQSNADRKAKADACRELSVIGTPAAVPALAALLASEEMNHMARYALETIPDPAAGAALRDALSRLKGRPLVGVIGSIGVRRDAQATEALARLLWDGDADVAQAAARALGRIGSEEAAGALMNSAQSTGEANLLATCEGIGRALDHLLAQGKRQTVLEICSHHANPQLPHQVRAAALRGLILAAGKDAPQILGESLRDAEYTQFATTVRAAQELKGAEVAAALAATLKQLGADRQIVVLQTLGELREAAGLPAMLELAATGEKAVRLAAIRALPMTISAQAVPRLSELATAADKDIAQSAQDALASLPGTAADNAITGLLAAEEASRQLAALEMVGKRRLTAALPALAKLASSADTTVRATAIKRLGELGSDAELPALLGQLGKATDTGDIAALEQALGGLSSRAGDVAGVVSRITREFKQAAPAPAAALLRVLGTLGGPQALATVKEALKDSRAGLGAEALRVLTDWKTADAAPELLAQATSARQPADKLVALRGYLGFASSGEVPADARLRMCREAAALVREPAEKKLLLAALGSIHMVESAELIAPHLGDAGVREEAAAAVVGIAQELLQGNAGATAAPKLAPLLEQAAGATANADLAKRARTQLDRARAKASGQ
jgi:HEAT repeat protein